MLSAPRPRFEILGKKSPFRSSNPTHTLYAELTEDTRRLHDKPPRTNRSHETDVTVLLQDHYLEPRASCRTRRKMACHFRGSTRNLTCGYTHHVGVPSCHATICYFKVFVPSIRSNSWLEWHSDVKTTLPVVPETVQEKLKVLIQRRWPFYPPSCASHA